MRVLAYTQLLSSYASLTLPALAAAFGVSVEFVDAELAKLIAADRLHASIDRVNGVVETSRPERKTAQYETVVRQGDVVLNAVQRLSKVLY
jgi:26S proteasome regulatory subunit N7